MVGDCLAKLAELCAHIEDYRKFAPGVSFRCGVKWGPQPYEYFDDKD
jgi:hypothetical protein